MRLPTLSPAVRAALAAAPLLMLGAGPASAQFVSREAIELHDEIYQLQQQVQALQQQIGQQGQSSPTYLGGYPGAAQPSSGGGNLVAQLLQKVDSLSQQVRELRGQVQEADNKIQQQGADLGKRISDLQFQMQHPGMTPPAASGLTPSSTTPAQPTPLAQGTSPATSPPPAPLGTNHAPPAATHPAPARTAEAALRQGEAAFARHDYPAAEGAAREVLKRFRTSPRAYDAQYLLAESLQGERRYPQAAITYDDVYNRSRKGPHAQQALIGLAASLTAINENKAACDTLAKLHAEFPHQSPAIRNVAEDLHQRAHCK